MASPTAMLATEILEEPIEDWIQRHRNDERSWRWIAARLYETTSQQVQISGEHLRQIHKSAVAA